MRMKWMVPACLAVLWFLFPFPARADEEPPDDKTLSPYFLVENGDRSVDRFPLKETAVAVNITGVIAHVTVTQSYLNDGKRPINARYVFPASTRASVHGMKMTLGNRVVTARIRERQAAKEEFAKAKSEGKSASLLEEQRPNVFTMSLANIMPGDRVLIELNYSELLVPTDGTYEFVFPTVVGPRYSNRLGGSATENDTWVKSPYLKGGQKGAAPIAFNVNLSTGIPIQELLCPSHKMVYQWKEKSAVSAVLPKSGEFAGDRDFILRYRLAGKEIRSGLMLHEGEKENFFLLMVQPPEKVEQTKILPREYVFILDVSGSMNGFPLETAKGLITRLIGSLRPTDRFNVVLFAASSEVMASSSLPANPENIRRALRLIDGQQGSGGTELAAALKRALALPRQTGMSRSAVIITDGYIAAEREAFQLIGENLDETNVFSFGIGSSVNRYLVEGIARAGMGESFVVTKPEEAPEAAERFREYVQAPLLTDVQVAFKGFDAYDVEPPSIPDLFARRPLVLFGKWRGKQSGEIIVSGKSATGPYAATFRVEETRPEQQHAPLKYLWARSRVARLSDYNIQGEDEAIKKEVTELGLNYTLLTPYTSFIAVLEEIRNRDGAANDVDQPLPLPKGVSELAVDSGYASVPEPGLTLLLAATAAAMLGIGLFRRRMGKN